MYNAHVANCMVHILYITFDRFGKHAAHILVILTLINRCKQVHEFVRSDIVILEPGRSTQN